MIVYFPKPTIYSEWWKSFPGSLPEKYLEKIEKSVENVKKLNRIFYELAHWYKGSEPKISVFLTYYAALSDDRVIVVLESPYGPYKLSLRYYPNDPNSYMFKFEYFDPDRFFKYFRDIVDFLAPLRKKVPYETVEQEISHKFQNVKYNVKYLEVFLSDSRIINSSRNKETLNSSLNLDFRFNEGRQIIAYKNYDREASRIAEHLLIDLMRKQIPLILKDIESLVIVLKNE